MVHMVDPKFVEQIDASTMPRAAMYYKEGVGNLLDSSMIARWDESYPQRYFVYPGNHDKAWLTLMVDRQMHIVYVYDPNPGVG